MKKMNRKFYVTIIRGAKDGPKVGYLSGPYMTYEAAELHVPRCRRIACDIDMRAHWDMFGVTAMELPEGTEHPKGVLDTKP